MGIRGGVSAIRVYNVSICHITCTQNTSSGMKRALAGLPVTYCSRFEFVPQHKLCLCDLFPRTNLALDNLPAPSRLFLRLASHLDLKK